MFETTILLTLVFPLLSAAAASHRWWRERQAIATLAADERTGELLPPKRARKTTKHELLARHSEWDIDSARRVLVASRDTAERAALARRVAVLQLADKRRAERKNKSRSKILLAA